MSEEEIFPISLKHENNCEKHGMSIQTRPVMYRFHCPICKASSRSFNAETLKANGWDKDFNVKL